MKAGKKRFRSEINVTPLVDVVLVLLIVFMVVTPMLQHGKPVELPEANLVSRPETGGDPLTISITRDRRIWIDKKEVSAATLTQALAAEIARAPGVHVVVKGDRALDYKTFREAVLEISKTRIQGVSLAAVQPKDAEVR